MLIQTNGILEPFGIHLSRESQMTLMAPANATIDENEYAHGEIDFGTKYGNGEYVVRGIIEHNQPSDREAIIESFSTLFIRHMKPQPLIRESKPELMTYAWLTGRPNFEFYPTWIDITFTMRLDSFWYGVTEKSLTGSGALFNGGTRAAHPTIEISGPITDPSITISNYTLSYTGTIASEDTLVITVTEDGAGTAKIGSLNAMDNYNSVFPVLQPGNTNVIAGGNVTIKWRDCLL